MVNAERLLNGLVRHALSKSGRKMIGKTLGGAAKVGGTGLVVMGGLAALAYHAYQARQAGAPPSGGQTPPPPPSAGQTPPPPPGGAAVPPPPPDGGQGLSEADKAQLLLQAMIEAAKADGTIDEEERRRILSRLDGAAATDEDREWLLAEMDAPPDIDALLARGAADPHFAAQIYAAALMAIDVDTDAERLFLDRLAAGLKLHPVAVATLHEQLGAPGPA